MPSIMAGTSVVDVTAAIAVIVWGLGGLIALRIAVVMSRRSDRPKHPAEQVHPTKPHGFRDAA
jgi:hypothetical protein